jgi:hypothetical protein
VKESVSADSARTEAHPEQVAEQKSGIGILDLQQGVGNAAVAALLQRQGPDASTGGVQNRPNLLGGQQLHLDPQIEAEMRRIELQAQLDLILHPERLQEAIRQIAFQPPAPAPAQPLLSAATPPQPQPLVPRGAGPETAHEASASDLMSAIMAVPAIDGALTNLKTQAGERVQRDWGHLSTGERALVITTGVTIAGTALAGAMANPDSRNFVLQQISGRDMPVPGIGGLSVQVNTQRENMGVMFTFDVGQHLPASWGFGGGK